MTMTMTALTNDEAVIVIVSGHSQNQLNIF